MTVSAKISDDGTVLKIAVDGKFDFSLLSDFRNAYTTDYGKTFRYVVDLRGTEAMDSSALGMLLNMKKHLQQEDRKIKITNCRPNLKKILLIARFDKKFLIV